MHERILLDCDMFHQPCPVHRFEVQELYVPALVRDGSDCDVRPEQDPELQQAVECDQDVRGAEIDRLEPETVHHVDKDQLHLWIEEGPEGSDKAGAVG